MRRGWDRDAVGWSCDVHIGVRGAVDCLDAVHKGGLDASDKLGPLIIAVDESAEPAVGYVADDDHVLLIHTLGEGAAVRLGQRSRTW